MRNIIQTQMHSKQLNFFMDTVDVIDEDIYCDKLHVNQVLLNLLSNAIKFPDHPSEAARAEGLRLLRDPRERYRHRHERGVYETYFRAL